MAYNSFLLVFLVLSFSCLTSAKPENDKSSNDLIGDICTSTHNPSTCSQVLRSDPQAQRADLFGLGRISIDIAQSNAKASINLVKSLAGKTTDPKLKEIYSSCSENFVDSIDDLSEAMKYLSSGDYPSVNIKASAALDEAVTCDDNFGKSTPEAAQLKQASQKFQDVCSIVLVISNRL